MLGEYITEIYDVKNLFGYCIGHGLQEIRVSYREPRKQSFVVVHFREDSNLEQSGHSKNGEKWLGCMTGMYFGGGVVHMYM